MGYIKALRLPIVVMAGLLAITAFRISEWKVDAWFVALFVVIVASATMMHNDLRDKEHDAEQGKTFALANQKILGAVLIFLWTLSLSMAVFLWVINPWYGILSVLIMISGLIYSEIRRIPLLPAVLVAVTAASPALYAGPSDHRVLFLFLASALLILAREIIKDLDDHLYDFGYKWTIPVVFGRRTAKLCAGIIVLLVPLVALDVSDKILLGTPFLSMSALYLILGQDHRIARVLLDVGMVVIVFTLLISGH